MTSPPSSVLHYAILDTLGAGGMGVVYRALDTRLERMVALKFLPGAASANPDARQRLLSEARAAARLDHPNIGAIYAVEGLEAELFIVMALYDGRNLRAELADGPMGVREAIDRCMQAARGLERAHEQGITHRDIKPENLFITTEGVVKVLDFGLARSAGVDGLTRAGELIGTPAYLSPEQARGQPVDARTDLWALGVVLYEAVTGMSPFLVKAGLAATLLRILRDEPEPASDVRPEVPQALDAIIERALAKDRNARYDTAQDLVTALGSVLEEFGRVGTAATTPIFPGPRGDRALAPRDSEEGPAPRTPGPATGGSSNTRPTTLPSASARLVGRQAELALADLHLADSHCRILTIVGPGGTGKTRLALEIVQDPQRLERYPDGIHFVALDALEDHALIPMRIADALHLPLQGRDDALTQVAHHIGDGRVMLALDNYEHLMGGAEIPSALLGSCPNLGFLVTSRERLNLEEEWVLPLSGLQMPPRHGATSPEEAERYEAASLFVQRARRANVRFSLESEDVSHLCEVCHLVGGSPLALEMAAAWTKMVSCEEIAREIRSNFDFLENTSRNVSARHRSLRATFEYSWALLNDQERDALKRLSAFRGGFTKEAAREVAAASVRSLALLVDKSLLEPLSTGRYDLHPIVRQYAGEKLAEHPDALRLAQDAHGSYYNALLQGQLDSLRGEQQAQAQALIHEEFENVRSAWQWAAQGKRLDTLAESLKPLDVFLDNRGRHREAVTIFRHAAAAVDDGDPAHRETLGDLLASEAWASWRLGRDADAISRAERSVQLLRPTRHKSLAGALNTLGAVAWGRGDYPQAKNAWAEALHVVVEGGDRRKVAVVLGNLASAEQQLGDHEAAKEHFRESHAIYRELGNPAGMATALYNLSDFARKEGDLDTSQALAEEAVGLAKESGLEVHLPLFLHGLGMVLMERERYEEAEPYYLEAAELAHRSGDKHSESWLLAGLGSLKTLQGAFPAARAHFAEALQLAWGTGYHSIALRCLVGISELQARTGDLALAMTYLHHVLRQPSSGESVRALAEGYLEARAGELSETEAAEAQRAGSGMPLEEAVAGALRYLGTA